MESDSGTLYLCGDFDVVAHTCRSGDLQSTVKEVSGFAPEELTGRGAGLSDEGLLRKRNAIVRALTMTWKCRCTAAVAVKMMKKWVWAL